MIKIGNLLLLALFLIPLSVKAVTQVTSSVDRNEMGLGDTFTFTVHVNSNDSVDITEPNLPEIESVDLINKWQQSAVSQKLVNTSKGMQFDTQRTKEFNFMLAPKKAGKITIPSLEINVEGKTYKTQAIHIDVSSTPVAKHKKAQPQAQANPFGANNFDDVDDTEDEMLNQLLKQRQQLLQQFGAAMPSMPGPQGGLGGAPIKNPQFRTLPKNPNEAFFIQVEVDKTQAYEGEQITVNWYLYTRGQMESLDRLKFPDLKGFWKEIIEEVPNIQFSEELVNGIPYKKALLASHALFPIKAGTAIIDEYKIKSKVRVPVDGMGGFFGRAYEFTKSSERVEIKVLPLPTDGRPSDFAGAVGQFEVHATVEGQSFPVNQPFSLKLRYEGEGNAKMIDLPPLNLPAGVEMYDSKSESKFFKNGRSYKEFEVLLIPRQEGELTIPGLSSSFFDSKAKKYYTQTTQPIKINIVANPNASSGPASSSMNPAAKGITPPVVKENVLPDILQTWQNTSSVSAAQKNLIWSGFYFLIVLSLLLKAQKEIGQRRARKNLNEIVQKRLKKIEPLAQKGLFRETGAEMVNLFNLVLSEVIGQHLGAQEIAKLLESASPSLRQEFGPDILKHFEYFQTLGFAPEEMLGTLKSSDKMKENMSSAKSLINRIIKANNNAETQPG